MAVGASPLEDAARRTVAALLRAAFAAKFASIWPCTRTSCRKTGPKTGKYSHFSNLTFPSVICAEVHLRDSVSRVKNYSQSNDPGWDRGREAYLDVPQKPVYAPVSKPAVKTKAQGSLLSISAEERFGSLIAAAGMIWGAYEASTHFTGVFTLDLVPAGPIEVCALGILVWLHAKWRRSTKLS